MQKAWFETKFLKEFGSYVVFCNLRGFLKAMADVPGVKEVI